jgi:AcrR family transcriptional regulator
MTRIESQAVTRQHLLDAAEALFERQGFYRTSVGEIAEEAGYTTGAFYSNFTRKEDIALAILERSVQAAWAILLEELHGIDDLADRLVIIVRWRNRLITSAGPLGYLRLELSLHSRQDPELLAALTEGQRQLRAVVERLVQEQADDVGATLLVEPGVVASALLGASDGTAVAGLIDPDGPDRRAYAFALASLLVNALDPRPVSSEEWPDFVDRLMKAVHRGGIKRRTLSGKGKAATP